MKLTFFLIFCINYYEELNYFPKKFTYFLFMKIDLKKIE
jgi:hypothetical protein